MLSPAVVAAIDDLELAARLVVEGLRAGGNRSPFRGYSTEFDRHRPYRAGDDLKHLDWKLFARSDRLHTRQFRATTNVPVMLVLDASASMGYAGWTSGDGSDAAAAGATTAPVSKLRYGAIVASAVAWLASEEGNAVGFVTMSAGNVDHLPPRGGRPHLRSIISRLDRLQADGKCDPERMIDYAAQLMRRKGIVLVLSDFYDAEEETARALRRLTRHGHDVSAWQLLSRSELSLDARTQVEFEDVESQERRLVDAGAAAESYRSAIEAFLERCRASALHAGIDYARFVTDEAPERALREQLQRRGGAIAR